MNGTLAIDRRGMSASIFVLLPASVSLTYNLTCKFHESSTFTLML